MKLINKKNGWVLADNLEVADSFLKRTKGLLGRSGICRGEGLHIIPCSSIHSFFMKFDFDAVFINKKNEVVYLNKNMPAWRVSKVCFSANSVIELPAGIINETETEIGDVLEFSD